MRRPGVIARQEWQAVVGDDGLLVVVSGDRPDVIQRVPENDGDEFDLVPDCPAQQVTAAKSFLRGEARQKFGLQMRFVRFSMLGCRESVPDAGDHKASSSEL